MKAPFQDRTLNGATNLPTDTAPRFIGAMIKSQLILRIAAENPHLYEADIERVVNAILGRILDALVAGERVELRGLGTFSVTERSAWNSRNPKTGATVTVETKKRPQFKASKSMHARLNPSGIVTKTEMDAGVKRLSRAS